MTSTQSRWDTRTRQRALAFTTVLLLLGFAAGGCARTDRPPETAPPPVPSISLPPRLADRDRSTPPPPASPTPLAPAPAGVRYRLPDRMCRVADLTPLQDIYPKREDTPLLDTSRVCDTAVISPAMVVGITLTATLLPNADVGRAYYDTARRLARGTPTDIGGAGTAAFFTAGPNKVELVTHHGNLALHVTGITVNNLHQLPNDLPDRLARVAAGTYAHLPR